jgi:capsular polysaccharide biosynthesis protein
MSKKCQKLNRRLVLILLLSVVVTVGALQTAKAATITSATLDKDTYLAGQTGYISVSVYNDKNDKIRVADLSATIDYYYTDGTVYVQKFFTSVALPYEIQPGQTKTFQIPISLPTNIAPGYINLVLEARTDLWVNQTDRWTASDRATYQAKLYIESLYKQSYENSQQQLQSTQQQLQEQKSASDNLSNMAIGLAVATLSFAGIAAFLAFILTRRPKPIAQPQQ